MNHILYSLFLLPFLLPRVSTSDVRFADVTTTSGLTHAINGGGVCIIDVDNDGLEDIFIAGANGRNLLYRNLGGLLFEEVAGQAGIDSTGWTRLAVSADFDGDGLNDLLFGCHEEPTRLFRNEGGWTFADVTGTSGILNSQHTTGGAWFDHDGDTRPDVYVANLLTPNILCINNGDGTFEEIASSVNAEGPTVSGLVMGLAVFDYDRDGDGDIFLAQDGNRGSVLLRREENGNYSDVSEEAGVNLGGQGMGVGVGDFNRDGFFDVYITNLDESTLLQNNGDGTFSDVTGSAGVGDEPAHMGWGTFFFDADNDGWLDIYNNNQTGFGGVPNSFYRNLGDETFEDLSSESGLMSYNDGIGSAYADLDNDGDLDVVLAGSPSLAGNLKLFENITDDPHHWIQLTLHSQGESSSAVGSIVELHADNITQWSMVSAGNGYVSQNTLRQHFGLGSADEVDEVIVHWPDGLSEMFGELAIDTHHQLIQGTGVTDVGETPVESPTEYRLEQNYPNPFNSSSSFRFSVSSVSSVQLTIYDLLGEEISVLVDQKLTPGTYTRHWDASNHPSGIYFYTLRAGSYIQTRKTILLK